MLSILVQTTTLSSSNRQNPTDISSASHSSPDVESISRLNLTSNYSLKSKFLSVIKWLTDSFRCCPSSMTRTRPKSKYPYNTECLRPEFNRVNGLLKNFAFGVMFSNGLLGFILFFIGLWSALEHRKINRMPIVTSTNTTSLNPFNIIGIILCIFSLLFFALCITSCLGINRENLTLLRISFIGQFLTLISFITLAILILASGSQIRNRMAKVLMIGLNQYYHIDQAWTSFLDKLQLSYFCCGIYSFSDWNGNPNYACTTSNVAENPDACSVPFTCCKTRLRHNQTLFDAEPFSYTCGANVLTQNSTTMNLDKIQERVNVNGCFDEILPVIQQLVTTAAIFMLLICSVIFLTIFLTCLLTFEIRLTKSIVRQHCRKKSPEKAKTESEQLEKTF